MRSYIFAALAAIFVVGCAARMYEPTYGTLQVVNNSGYVIHMYIKDGIARDIGRVYPGTECITVRQQGYVFFGVQHASRPIAWMHVPVSHTNQTGWRLMIGQPPMDTHDMNGIMPAERC